MCERVYRCLNTFCPWFCPILDRENQAMLLSANEVICGQWLQSTFDIWLGFWTSMVNIVQKLNILSDNCSYQTLVFLVVYRHNTISFQSHFSCHTYNLSFFYSPDFVVKIIHVSDSWSFTLYGGEAMTDLHLGWNLQQWAADCTHKEYVPLMY